MTYSTYVKNTHQLRSQAGTPVPPVVPQAGTPVPPAIFRRKALLLLAPLAFLTLSACGPTATQGWSGPSVDDGAVYLPTLNGKLIAYDSSNGDPRWQAAIQGAPPPRPAFGCAPPVAKPLSFYSNPSFDRDTVYVGSHDGIVFAVNKSNGAVKWQYPRVDRVGAVVGGIAVGEKAVFFGSSDGKVYALNASNGVEQWSFATGGKIWATPALKGDNLFVGSFDGSVYALNASSGALVWKFETGGAITAEPLVTDNTVYVGSFDRHLYALDPATGKARWSFAAEGWFWSMPAIRENVIVATNLDGNVYAIDAPSGNRIWKHETKGAIRPSPVIAGDNVVVVSEDKNLYYLKAGSGALVRATPLPVPVLASLAVRNNLVYVYTRQGLLIAFNSETGIRVWEVPTSA